MRNSHFYCKPAKGERIETRLQIAPDVSAAIHGVVADLEGRPIPAALLFLFRVDEDAGALCPLAQTKADPDGHFAFGGLEGDVLYRIKVFQQNENVRAVELCPEREEA